MGSDRTGGSRSNVGVNPPVVHFSTSFKPKSDPPEPFSLSDLRAHASAKGFIDGDTDQAEYFLGRISYQHASGYFKLFQNEDGALADDASLMMVHRAVLFDRKLQSLLMEYIGLFELQFRAQYSYRLSEERGAFAHRNPKNFKDAKHFKDFLNSYEREFRIQMKNNNADVIRAFDVYGDVPTWQAVEMMSFGTLSKMYSNTRSKTVRSGVAMSFGVTVEELVSWARAISSVRNQCAHFGQLCGKPLVSRPKRIAGASGDNGSVFYIVMLLVRLLGGNRFFPDDKTLSYGTMMLASAVRLFDEFSDVSERCGIPEDWRELITQREVVGVDVVVRTAKKGLIATVRRMMRGNPVLSIVDSTGAERPMA